jgi:membrane associated rhomboid family serine protease
MSSGSHIQTAEPTNPLKGTASTALSSVKAGGIAVGALLAIMWVLEVLDIVAGDLDGYGIAPRQVSGLDGIIWAPFLHVSFGHLIANTVPFVIMGGLIALANVRRFLAVFAVTAVVSGLGTWLTGGAGTVHLGASGVVFGFLGYLLARGLFDRKLSSIALGIAVGLGYGGLLFGVLPSDPSVSWQAHLFGFIGGVIAASQLARRKSRKS